MERISVLLVDDHALCGRACAISWSYRMISKWLARPPAAKRASSRPRSAARRGADGSGAARHRWRRGHRRVKSVSPSTRIIVLTSFADDDKVSGRQSRRDLVPAEGCSTRGIGRAIRAAQRNEAVLHSEVAAKLMQEFTQPRPSEDSVEQLTEREMDVLRLIAKGQSTKRSPIR